ncbi:hypothetical protein [Brucella sp. NBRC 12950]|uniref:hypothetical protein n=1 Tax=Brucella sp. NBRC 12950 TaxID=2994518 RepID=UPI0024A32AA4|nr:hypothetical protein [Brucella sp. NBRC 12950]GLU29500.1 hypothetical protein Brsp01_47330 [Brucella sp. NBRC 12950]
MTDIIAKKASRLDGSKWGTITNFQAYFDGFTSRNTQTFVYANGRNQAVLCMEMILADSTGTRLTNDNSPTIEEVLNAIDIIDYNTGDVLGAGTVAGWSFTSVGNVFHKQLTVNPSTAEELDGTADGNNTLVNGLAKVVFYISCDDSALGETALLGVRVTPEDSDGFDGIPVENSKDGTFHKPVSLISRAPITYRLSDLEITGQRIRHPNEVDGTLAFTAGDDPDDGNYWRQFDYHITLSQSAMTRYGTHLYRTVLESDDAYYNEYSFGERRTGYFAYKGYFWSKNVYTDVNSTSPMVPNTRTTFPMSSRGISGKTATVTTEANKLFMTMFCSAGGGISFQYTKIPLIITLYDEYGNAGKFMVTSDELPTGGFDATAFTKLNFLTEFIEDTTPSTDGDDDGQCQLAFDPNAFGSSPAKAYPPFNILARLIKGVPLFCISSGDPHLIIKIANGEPVGYKMKYYICHQALGGFNAGTASPANHAAGDLICMSHKQVVNVDDGYEVGSIDLSEATDKQFYSLKPVWDTKCSVVIASTDGLTKQYFYLLSVSTATGVYGGWGKDLIISNMLHVTDGTKYFVNPTTTPSQI